MQINCYDLQKDIAKMHNSTDWNDFHYFFTVALQGSLNSAAKKLGVNHSTVFRRINSLEEKMGVRLFKRLKTGYVLTEAGEEVLESAQRIEEHVYAIQRKLVGKDIRLRGILKISTTDTLGYYWLPPYVRRFKAQYPDIVLDINIRTRYTNLTKREADIVIPAVNKQPDYMVGRKLTPLRVNLYASADYIKQYGKPEQRTEFKDHQFLLPNEELAGLPANRWLRKYVPHSSIAAASDKLSGLYKLAQQSLGITPLPHYVGDSDNAMRKVMDLPKSCHHDAWILTHPDLRQTARVKAFMQFMYYETKAEERVG